MSLCIWSCIRTFGSASAMTRVASSSGVIFPKTGEKRIAFNGANEGSGNLPSKFGWELIETATVGG